MYCFQHLAEMLVKSVSLEGISNELRLVEASFFFSSRRRHTRCALVTGVQTCALPIFAPDEANFWQPSGSGEFKALQPGDLFLFKLKGKDAAIAGGGVFSHATLAPLSLAWEAFGQKNGNASDRKSTRLNSSH